MMRKSWAKLIVAAALIAFLVLLIPQIREPLLLNLTAVQAALTSNFLGIIIVAVIILAAIGIIIYYDPLIEWRQKLLGMKAAGVGKQKIYEVKRMREAAEEFVKYFGVDSWARAAKGHTLYIYSQFIDSPLSDTPYAYFLLTTDPLKMDQQNKLENIPRHKRWFIFIDRTANECSYNPDINTFREADEHMDKLRAHALPLEKKKTIGEKMGEYMLRGYGEKMGAEAAGAPKEEKPKEEPKEAKG